MPVWGRGRLLGVEPGARLCLLSIDYGVIATLPLSHVLPLPPQCKGVPPLVSVHHTVECDCELSTENGVLLQAIPCKLLGVAPIPVCTVVQENAAGVCVCVCAYVCVCVRVCVHLRVCVHAHEPW